MPMYEANYLKKIYVVTAINDLTVFNLIAQLLGGGGRFQ